MSTPGDYSMLLHNIESNIAKGSMYNSSNDNDNNSNSTISSNNKYNTDSNRKRLRSPNSINVSSRLSFSNSIIDGNDSAAASNSLIQIMLENDELRLQVEQYKDKIEYLADDIERMKVHHIRQIQFIEQENITLKKIADERAEKYYDEKKKWQSKIRSLESHKRLPYAAADTNAAITSSTKSTTPFASNDSNTDMQQHLLMKNKEVKELSTSNAKLNETISQLQQQLLCVKSNIVVHDAKTEEAIELKDLRKRCSDLETLFRRKSRDYDRLEQKVKNQNLLEEELSSTSLKLNSAQLIVDTAQSLESSLQLLQQEKKQWISTFKDIVKSESSSNTSDITPLSVLRYLSTIQDRYVQVQKEKGDVDAACATALQKVRKYEAEMKDTQENFYKLKAESNNHESRLQLANQKASLYSDEIKSLRDVIKLYNTEVKLGRTADVTDAMNAKDTLIEKLQMEIDLIRLQLSDSIDQSITANIDISTSQQQYQAENEMLKQEVLQLKDNLYGLQKVTGMDYNSNRTKVLHMICNPSTAYTPSPTAGVGGTNSYVSSIPMEQLKHLRKENKQLKSSVLSPSVPSSSSLVTNAPVVSTAAAVATAADSSKLNQRLKEMFKERITTFREAVYLLTGYKVDLYSADANTNGHPRLRLRSMYSDDPDDSLLFQWRDDVLELVETPLVAKLDPKLFAYLNQCNSVPAFLSNVTIDLFDNQTFAFKA